MADLSSPTPLASALYALAFIALLALLYGLSGRLRRQKDKTGKTSLFEQTIAFIRKLDRFLVHTFSWITGTHYRRKYVRLPILLTYFLSLTAASVFLPWPHNMVFIGIGVFSIFIVFRHWSRDEDEAISATPFERKDIKIDGTLGSEVLIAVAFLFVFAPIAFAQLQTRGIGFTLSQDAGPLTFLVYTLIETVKAGSLIDYYDLYADRIGLERIGAPSEPSSWAKATIMGYRLALNLLLLAAIKRLLDIAKRRAEGADLRAVSEALRKPDQDKQIAAIKTLRDFALSGRGNARDLLEKVAEPRQSELWPIDPQTRFEAASALLDYGTQRGGASALYAAADGYRALMRSGFDPVTDTRRWRAAAHNLGNTLVQLGQQIGDPQRLKDAVQVYEALLDQTAEAPSQAALLNTYIVRANVMADLAMMTGERADLEAAIDQYKIALSQADTETPPEQIALLNTNLGATLADLAEIDSDCDIIREAIQAYRLALDELSAETHQETWSMAQNNLGNALADLGDWQADRTCLEEAIEAHHQALTARQKTHAPLLWAMSQTNLANAHIRLAKLDNSPDDLRQAIDFYQAAQSVYQREDFPRDWAWSEASLASAYIDLGHMSEGKEAFEQAILSCDGAIGAYASAEMPGRQAWVQGLKGNALIGLERYEAAIECFQQALSWQTYHKAGDDWVMSVNNLAACQHQTGQHERALKTLKTALEEAPGEKKLISTRDALFAASAPEERDEADAQTGSDPISEDALRSRKFLPVTFLDWQMLDWNEGRYVNRFSARWTLSIEGQSYTYIVTEEEYIEEDGQGKGAGHEVRETGKDAKILYCTFWDHWMNEAYNPEQDSGVDGRDWKIGSHSGLEVFWAIYHHVHDQGIEVFSRWAAEEEDLKQSLLALGPILLALGEEEDDTPTEAEPSHLIEDAEAENESQAPDPDEADKRYYMISVQRLCGEFVIGRVSPDFYTFWKDREDFESQILSVEDPDHFDANSPSPYITGGDCEGWYAIDDIAHINNAIFHGNQIYVDEVRPDPDDFRGYAMLGDGYSEQFDIDSLIEDMPDDFYTITRAYAVDTDTETDTSQKHVFVGKSIEKGAQTEAYITTNEAFDIRKLSFDIWYMDGDPVIAAIRYDGHELDIEADSSMGRAFYAYLGVLES